MEIPGRTALTAILVLVAPLALGALAGVGLRRLRGRRVQSWSAALACVLVPAAALFGIGLRFPIVGLWDTIVEAALVGIGTLWAAHPASRRVPAPPVASSTSAIR